MDREWNPRIIQEPEILAGKPVVNGTRISVEVVLDYLASHPNFDDFLNDYPRLTIDDVQACLSFARTLVANVPSALLPGDGHAVRHDTVMNDVEVSQNSADQIAHPVLSLADHATVWESVRSMEGQTLPTVSERATFDVAEVSDRHVRIVIRSSGNQCNLERQRLEHAVALGLARADIMPSDLRQASIENPTYAAAILRAVVRQSASARSARVALSTPPAPD